MNFKKRANTSSFDELLEEYALDRRDLASSIAAFKLRGREKDEDYNYQLSCKTKMAYLSIRKYARKETTPNLSQFLLMLNLIGCGVEELLLTFKINEDTKKLLTTLNLDKNKLNHDDIELLKKGCKFKLLEVHNDYQIHAQGHYLKATKYLKLMSLQSGLSEVENLIAHNSQGNQVSTICRNSQQRLLESGQGNFFTVALDSTLEKGDIAEITIDLFYGQVDIQDASFYTTYILHPTDLLKFSCTFSGLNKIIPVQFYQYSNNTSYRQDVEPVVEESILLDKKNASFEKKFVSPTLNSVFRFNWSGLTKRIRYSV